MFKKVDLMHIFILLTICKLSLINCKEERKIDAEPPADQQTDTSLAEELLNVAQTADYNLTLNDIDMAAAASTEQEIEEALPLPVAEKLIDHRRRNDIDTLREQMIGMIFTGKPHPLGYRRHRPLPLHVNRRRFRTRPKRPPLRDQPHFHGMDEASSPQEILKPMPFVPRHSNVEFPVPPLPPNEPKPRRPQGRPPSRHRPRGKPRPKSRPKFHSGREPLDPLEPAGKDEFSDTLGPDFGPVTFEEFGANFASPPLEEAGSSNDFHDSHNNFHDSHNDFHSPSHSPNDFHTPEIIKASHKPSKPPSGFSNTKFGHFDEFPKFEDKFPSFGETIPAFGEGPTFAEPPVRDTFSVQGGCHTYTEDICLDAENYPHEAILSSLAGDPSRTNTLMAEVREQSADDLVDGVTAAQESKYDFAHYYGNRRQDNGLRDFARDGGYLCPSEVKYARPKRARNSKGEWKFIVNMKKYTQTIRMEKCMKPGGTCSYVSHHYRATCNQIHNYQRLLSWEKSRGLHMDIFKVPSCCSCHIQGYAYLFPPLDKKNKKFNQFDRSDKVTNLDNLETVHKVAPPYSPVNFPNIARGRAPTRRRSPLKPRVSRPRERPRESIRRSNVGDTRVNYGYHPIIDFFEKSSSK